MIKKIEILSFLMLFSIIIHHQVGFADSVSNLKITPSSATIAASKTSANYVVLTASGYSGGDLELKADNCTIGLSETSATATSVSASTNSFTAGKKIYLKYKGALASIVIPSGTVPTATCTITVRASGAGSSSKEIKVPVTVSKY